MPKTIYTDRDIDDLARRGVKELAVSDDVYLTDLARERAERVGMVLRATPNTITKSENREANPSRDNNEQVVNQVKAAVIAKLGAEVDAAMIERIVRRVVEQL
ncbi:MAG: hypothetical protein HY257_00995 [Chloroflexi bacterium]|nr:hypothetical protein [Chloroflexota bacterium]